MINRVKSGSLVKAATASSSLLVGILLCALLIFMQPASDTDKALSDRLLVSQKTAADDSYLLVEVTGQDVVDYGRPALSRSNMTKLISKIRRGNPERLLIDFAAEKLIKDQVQRDRAQALESFDKAHLGLVTAVSPDDLPARRFAEAATMLDGRLSVDKDGWHRRLGTAVGNNPAIWLASGKVDTATVQIDLRIDHGKFERASAGDVFQGKVDVTGRKVVLSASPEVFSTRAYLPLTATASRASVFAISAQSHAQGYSERFSLGQNLNVGLSILASVLGLLCAWLVTSGRRLVILGIATILAIAASHLSLALYVGVPITLTTAISCFLIIANATLAHRFKIFPMLQNFMRGDLSPEEVWAWRSQEQSGQPAILFGADGSIKRLNEAGEALVQAFGDGFAAACLPTMGKRADEISFCRDNRVLAYKLTWPYPNVALTVGWDMTAAREQHESLLGQLYSDELTGCINRRGFDRKLLELSQSGQGYRIFFIDLNGFKAVNDTYGHDAGDELLVECADRLNKMVRGGDCVARLGGDEFAILMGNQQGPLDPREYIDRIVKTITVPISLTVLDETVSVGAAVGHAAPEHDQEDSADVLRRADQAMYAHKKASKQGRDSRRAA